MSAARPAQKQTWGDYFGVSEAARAASKARKEAEVKAKHDAAVADLKQRLLSTEEGVACGKQLAETGEWGPDGRPEQLVDDAHLRRWLVARDWNVDVTYKLLLHHGGWRAYVLEKGYISEADIAKPLADNTIFLPGCDREGRALIIVKVANHQSKGRDLRQMKLFSVFIMEAMVALCDRERNPSCRLSSMFDLSNCSYANLDIAVMKNILGILSTHYVERLSVLYFYNPPTIFWALWNASKNLLPEVTRNKIKVIDPSDVSELHAWMAPDVLPKEYGGEGELLSLTESKRRFKLPPFDGRLTAAEAAAAEAVPLPGACVGSGAAARMSAGVESDGGEDAFLEVEEEAQAGKGGVEAAAPRAAGAVTAVA